MSTIDAGVRIARTMMDEQHELASKAAKEGRGADSEAHYAAARILLAISATCGKVSDKTALEWMRDERTAESVAKHHNLPDMALSCGYAASVLEHLALRIRADR